MKYVKRFKTQLNPFKTPLKLKEMGFALCAICGQLTSDNNNTCSNCTTKLT